MYNREINALKKKLEAELARYSDEPRRLSVAAGIVRAVGEAIKQCNPNFDEKEFSDQLLRKYETTSW